MSRTLEAFDNFRMKANGARYLSCLIEFLLS